MQKNYYEILGIEQDASLEEIKATYRQLAKRYHPDLNKSPDAHDRFIEITEAYEVLANPVLQRQYYHMRTAANEEVIKAAYEKAERAAHENARHYARMKYEKFVKQQEAFKKSGWYDLVLLLHYTARILVFPIIIIFILLPLVSEEVSEDPSGYFAFWLLALILIFYVLNNRKAYFKLGKFYYSIKHLTSLFIKVRRDAVEDCYYSKGRKADSLPYKITLFKLKKLEMMSFYAPDGRQRTGMSRKIKTISIPRSRKALIVHSILPFIKIATVLFFIRFVRFDPIKDYALFLGFPAGGLLSSLVLLLTRTRSKASFLLSYGMLIKLFIWGVTIYFAKSNALLLAFFDPVIEAVLRFISDGLFRPLIKQYRDIEILFKNNYQLYLELPIWSALVPFLRWLF